MEGQAIGMFVFLSPACIFECYCNSRSSKNKKSCLLVVAFQSFMGINEKSTSVKPFSSKTAFRKINLFLISQ